MFMRGKYAFLSNFYECPITCQGIAYRSSENLYQAAKTKNLEMRKKMAERSPGQAKRLGRRIDIRPDWEEIKVDAMRWIVKRKFAEHPDLAAKLIGIDGEIVEDNTWGDRFWGRVDGQGENWLGKILMEVRDELRQSSPAKG